MKTLSLILIGTLMVMLIMPSTASALSLTASAYVPSGTSLGPHFRIACNGYAVPEDTSTFDPWTNAACYNRAKSSTALTFGGKNGATGLVKDLYNADGTVKAPAGCFYAANFYIIYLYPNAWGGKGYQLTQAATVPDSDVANALIFAPVYASQDQFCWGPDPANPCAPGYSEAQGPLNSDEEAVNPQLTPSVQSLAINGELILKAGRSRVVRAEYGIPPKPGTGQTRPSGWTAIPLTKTSGTYTGSVTITLTELPSFP